MIDNKRILAIIPARGGSKGVPRKNILDLGGKPLIAWSIETALACKHIDKILISTDDLEIADISKKYKAEVPFLRPSELASDTASTLNVLMHAINWLKKNEGSEFEYVLLLQPTSPLRTVNDIKSAIRLFNDKEVRAVVSVCETDHPPAWSNTLPDNGNMKNFLQSSALNTRRQDLSTFYRLNGALYMAEMQYFDQYKGFLGPKTFAYKMPKKRSIDIDSEIDFKLAEILLIDQN